MPELYAVNLCPYGVFLIRILVHDASEFVDAASELVDEDLEDIEVIKVKVN